MKTKFSLKFVPRGLINNIQAFVRRQAIIWTDDGLLFTEAYMRYSTPIS